MSIHMIVSRFFLFNLTVFVFPGPKQLANHSLQTRDHMCILRLLSFPDQTLLSVQRTTEQRNMSELLSQTPWILQNNNQKESLRIE